MIHIPRDVLLPGEVLWDVMQ